MNANGGVWGSAVCALAVAGEVGDQTPDDEGKGAAAGVVQCQTFRDVLINNLRLRVSLTVL